MGLRPGYKQTDVGVIPKDWDVCPLSNLLERSRGVRYGIVQPGKYQPNGCLMLRSQDYSRGWTQPDAMHRVTGELESQYKNARIRRGDLIMTVVGAGIGQVVIVPDWLDGAVLSRSTARIAVDDSRAARDFVKASLESPVGKRQILDCQKEGAQPVVSCPALAKFLLPRPPLTEQNVIREALSDVDELLGTLDKLIAKKRDLRQAAMQHLLSGEIRLPGPSVRNRQRATELGPLPEDWRVLRIEDIASVKTGPFGSTLHEEDYVSDGTPIVTVEHLGERGIRHADLPMVSDIDRGRLGAYSLRAGDIVFSRVGSVDRNALVSHEEEGWLFSGRLLRLRPADRSVDTTYLSQHLHSEPFKQRVRSVAVGQTMASLNTRLLKGVLVVLPPLEEQIAIGAILSDVDAELSALEQRRDMTRLLKQGMMQELLTGRTRLV